MPVRETKRQRVNKDDNPFLDLVAVDGSEDDDDNISDCEEGGAEEFHEEDMLVDCAASHLALQQRISHREDHDGTVDWQGFLERAYGRSARPTIPLLDLEDFQPSPQDALWELRCTVGREESVAYDILCASLENTSLDGVRSVIGRTCFPGRVFVESRVSPNLPLLGAVSRFIRPSFVRPVPLDERLAVLSSTHTGIPENTWVRIRDSRRKWSVYRGDTGYVTTFMSRKVVALVPRIPVRGHDETARPPPSLCTMDGASSHFRRRGILNADGRSFSVGKAHFSVDGLLLVPLSDITVFQDPCFLTLPTLSEVSTFQSCSLIPEGVMARTRAAIQSSRIAIHQTVRIVSGDFLGLLATVVAVHELELDVRVHMFGVVECVLISSVRTHHAVGDQVVLLEGVHKGHVCWVVGVSPSSLELVTEDYMTAITVEPFKVRFHEHVPSSVHLIPRAPHRIQTGRDPNSVYVGLRVCVVRTSIYKGYRGIIKNTTVDGNAWVELEACQQRKEWIPLHGLSIIREFEPPSSLTVGENTDGSSTCTIELPLEPAAHPAPDIPAPTSSESTADNASNFLPWLLDPAVAKLRVKLCLAHGNNEVVEVTHASVSDLRVRQGMRTRKLSWRSVLPCHPSIAAELVTPVTGVDRGTVFKVRGLDGEMCTVRKPGYRPRRGEADPTYRKQDLVSIFPSK